ncbi:BapA/Bap/LapF family large adhesin [Pseudomonas putida]|uniref:BapA prefix-like domain-containing protein n=1 Tax=Pseudomonas putida TaxID=303 RepID=A0A6I6Y3P3_PSEPU|nr:BapA/Bap/LapF family large adhesin [Pseudomonas putida]QHG66965.1 BapA prefix-like domain-containing protein [Pseudomonas putida]
MDNIVVADKQSAVATQNAWGNITLNSPGVVQMPVAPDQVATVTRRGQDLIVTLKSGEKVTVGNFFAVDQAGVGSDMVFVGEDGTLWHANYDTTAFTGFTFDEVASLDELVAGIGVAGAGTSTFAIAGLSLLGVGGAAAAANNSSGGGGGGSAPGDTTPPTTPIDLLVSPDGLRLSGRGEAGATVKVFDAAGNLIGSGTVNADGSFNVALNTPQANGENLGVTLTDPAGNASQPGAVTAPDTTAPTAPTELAINAQGNTLTGSAEPGSTVQVVGANGAVLGSAVAGADGQFSVTLQPPQTDGQPLQVTVTDPAGNVSSATTISAPDDGVGNPPDTAPPGSPTDLVIGQAGQQLSGRGEAGASVQVRDAQGNLIASGTVAGDGNFLITLDPPVNDGSSVQVTLTDAAGNVSQPGSVTSPDLQPPAQPTDLALVDGVTFSGKGEANCIVQVRDGGGNLIGTGTVGADGNFSITLSPAQANGEALDVRLLDAAGNTSAPLQFDAPDITAPNPVSGIAVGPGGLQLAGSGEAGATVAVRDASGNLIGTATVSANGTFIIDLAPAAQPGEQLSIVQTDAAGNASTAVDYAVPSTTVPTSPTDLTVAADGSSLSGIAPAGTRVDVRDANGTVVGSVLVGGDGTFTVALSPAQANGELLNVTAVDADGTSSLPAQVSAPDITAPSAPADLAVSADGSTITGRAEVGSTVRVLAADGTTVLGTAVVDATGVFSITLTPAQVDGEALQVTATDAAGNTSTAGNVTAPDIDGGDTTPPDAPTNLVIGLAGQQLSGRGEVGASVQVRDAQGNLIASGTVAGDGNFLITLNPPVNDGSSVQVTLTDAAGNVSQPGSVTSLDLQPPAQPTDLALVDGVTLSGKGEPNSIVQVHDGNGNLIGSGTVGADGNFSITLSPAQANGETLDVRLTDAAGNTSAPLDYTAPDNTPPAEVSNIVVGSGGLALSGRGEAGATVEVRDSNNTLLGTGTVAANGSFLIDLDPAVQPGERLSLVQTDAAGNASPALQYDVPLAQVPDSPNALVIAADGSSISGNAPAGTRVDVRDANGTVVGSVVVGADGTFTVVLNPAQANGELLDVTAVDTAGTTSLPTQVSAPDITAPTAPGNLAVSADGSTVTGRAEPGSTVRVLAADGTTVLGTAVAGASGAFSVTVSPAQVDGEQLQVTATDAAGNTSTAGNVTAPDVDGGGDTTAPQPATDLIISADGRTVSGRGEINATVNVLNDQGQVIGTGTVQADGTFTLQLTAPVVDGSSLQVTLTDAAGNVSTPSPLTSPDHLAPAQPIGLSLTDGITLAGTAEPGARIDVRDADGNLIGSGIVAGDGSFSLVLAPAQANGEQLSITATDAAGNASAPLSYTAPDTTPPAIISDVVVGDGSLTVSGRGEPGATVEIRDGNGTVLGTGVVAANGTFLVNLDNPVTAGESLVLVQTDAAGNPSVALTVIVPATEVPESPSGLVVAGDGTSISGSAPAGSLVEVRDANGSVVGSVQAGNDGTFTISLNPAQANGELLDVVAIDADGNSSLPTQISAPDITPPNQASDLLVSADGATLTGRGEPGSTVQVTNAQGTLLGSAVVGANGQFSVTLAPAQTDGQALDVVLRDAAGNSSTANITAPDTDGPLQPSGLAVDITGLHLTGLGQVGSTVTVRAANGSVLGTALVGADGRFDVTLTAAQRNGESLTVEATDSLGNSAGPVTFSAPDHTPPQVVGNPTIDGTGTTVSGTGEPGATVTVRGPDGSVLGSVLVAGDGSFAVTLVPPQTNGQALTVEQTDLAGNVSAAVGLPAPDTQAPNAPIGLLLSADGAMVTGSGEPGAQVKVTGVGGVVLGTAVVQADGSFSVSLIPAQLNGQTLSVTQTDGGGNASGAGTVVASDLQAPSPAVVLGLVSGGTVLNGVGEIGTTVEVRNSAGQLLGDGIVGADGSFSITLSAPQTNGQVLSVVLIDGAGNNSPSTSFTAPDTTGPATPAGLQVSADGSSVHGTGEVGATVEVRNAAGDLLGSVVVPVGGSFSVALTPAQLDGQTLQVTLLDPAGNASTSAPVNAPDITPPELPVGLLVSPDGSTVTGSAPGASSVTVTDPNGNVVTVAVNGDGSFSVPLDTPLTNGETLSVVVSDAAGNATAPSTVTAPDTTPPAPAADVTVSPDGGTISGSAEPGTTVIVRDGNTVLGTGTAGPDGTFVIPVNPHLVTGDTVQVVVRDGGNNETSINVSGPDGTEAATPSALSLSADGFLLTGEGTVGSLITVTSGGTTLGTGTVGTDGVFHIFFANALLNAQTLQVSARLSVGGKPSVPAIIVAADTIAPDAPNLLALDRTGSTLTGHGEVGATVRVVDAQGTVLGTATVASNGLFSVTLVPPQANGQNLTITQADAAGNTSLAVTLQAADLQAPNAATGLSLNSAATVVSGQGEAGATVTVRDASGAILATGTVNLSGQFQITLPSAQTTGSPLQVTLTDAAGNVSGPASLATPDRTPPAAVANPVLSADGKQLSGSGEVGATVQVRNAAGTVLGSAIVGTDGRFTVTFDTPQISGQAIGVSQVDAAGNVSPAISLVTPDLTAPTALTNVVLNNNGLTLTGLGEAGASVTVRGADGTIIGTGLVAANGSFTLTLTSAQLNAQHLSVTQTDASNNTSTAVSVIAPDHTPPAAPSALALSSGGLQLSGNAEAGSTVTVRDAAGNVLGTAVATSNGTFQLTLNSAQNNGQILQVSATDAAGNVSTAASYTAADTTPPAAVASLAVAANGATLAGTGEVGATVTVRAPDGTILGTAVVGADGHFSVTLIPAASTGEILSVTQADAALNTSPALTVTAPGITAPDIPGNLVLSANGLAITGTATPGTTVNVYGPSGALLGSAPVGNDGTFTVALGSAQANGEVLHVSAVGTDGGVSLPATLQAPDTTAPQPLSSLVLSADGLILTGHGEAGATVTVTGLGGLALGTAVVDANGNFTLNLSAAQINGQLLSAAQTDAAGNESNSISLTAPDRVAPDAAANLAFAGGGTLLNGTGEANAQVKVVALDGSVLGTGVVLANGTFQVALLTPQANGQQVQVVLTDAAGNQSTAAAITAPDTTPPNAPSELAISSDGVTITGRGEAGASVTVLNPLGQTIGTALVDASGHFTITLNPALGNAELLSFTQTDGAGNVSAVATLLTPDFTPPDLLTNVVINADGSVVSGSGEPGATVTVTNAAGVLLGTTLVLADGSFRVTLTPAQINQQVLSVQQADPPGNISEPVSVNAPDLTPPAAATALHLNAAGDQLSGTGEAGTTVRVYVGTVEIGTATVAANGTFVVNLSGAQLNGQVLQVTLQDASNNISPITTLTAADITPPATVVATLNASGTQISGIPLSAEAGAHITVMNNLGNLIGQGTVAADGSFVITLTTAQINGQVLTIIAQDATGNPSAPLLLTAPDLTPPVQPGNLVLTGGTLLTGTGEVGSTITVRAPDNTVLGTVTVPAGGVFSVTFASSQSTGQVLTVVSTDAAGNASLPATYQTIDSVPPAAVTNLAISNTYDILTGRGEAGATVTVSFGGVVIGTGVVGSGGTFSINLSPTPGSAASLAVTQTDAASNTSAVATYLTPLIPPPEPPVNVALAANGLTLTGTAATGTSIRVYDAAGNLIGSGSANIGNGGFSITLSAAQLNGQHLSVTSVSLLGGESQPVFLTAADITPPANPVVTALSVNGLVLAGTGEAGATVTVRDASGNLLGTGLVNGGGVFSINLASAQLNGQVLSLTQADAALNVSGITSYTVPDTQAPLAPTNLAINGTGTVLTGVGEAGATVTVTGPGGTALGTAVVQANGTFSVTLTTAQNDGQALVVRQADAAGNLSGSTGITAPDTTPPAAPVASINANGNSVSGSGEIGSTVTVRNSAGTVLGTATVGSNGQYVVSLSTAQINFQALRVTLTDAAGNTSTATTLNAPDLTPPANAANLVISADGTTLTGTGEVGATVTVRSASGTVLQTATVQPNGTFTVTLSPAQDNGQVLSVTLTDPRSNVSGNVNITAPDVDANAPVIASNNLATATVNLAPVTATTTYTDSFTTLLSGFSKTYTWTVAPGTTVDPTLTLTTNSVLALLNNSTFTLQVKDASGAWVTIATGNTQGLLDLIVLPLGLQVDIGKLQAGDYRLTVASGGIGLITQVTTSLDIEATSLTQFTGTGTATSGNVITDPGTNGAVDSLGPDSGAVLKILVNGTYVTAASGAGTTVQGQYGTLLIHADGSYTYTPSGSPSSVGKVDVFSYELVHPNGLTATANLYVRIDSPQATEIWNDSNLSAPATVVNAVNDIDSSHITLANRVDSSSATLGSLTLPLIGSRSATYTTTVATDTTANLQVVVNSANLLSLLNGTTIQLLKLNTSTGQYVVVQTVTGSSLVSLLGGGSGYTFQNQGAGTYHIVVSAGGIGLASSITTSLNTTTTHLTEYVVSSATVASGNLITDPSGTDTLGSALTVLSVLTAAGTYTIPGHNGVSVAGTYGTLLVQADGSYTYTLNSGLTSAVIGQHDTFTYELTHPNGTTDTATLTVNLDNAAGLTTFSALVADTSDDSVAVASVAASASSEVIAGTDGNDHLVGSQGGHITLEGGAGNDTLELVDQNFASVDGGTGTDTLLWGGGDASIDLGTLADRIHNIEVIDLNDTSAVALTLNLADVVKITETGNDTLIIKGDDKDSVHMTDNWALVSNQTVDGIDYNQYTAQEDPSHHLWVQNSIHVV